MEGYEPTNGRKYIAQLINMAGKEDKPLADWLRTMWYTYTRLSQDRLDICEVRTHWWKLHKDQVVLRYICARCSLAWGRETVIAEEEFQWPDELSWSHNEFACRAVTAHVRRFFHTVYNSKFHQHFNDDELYLLLHTGVPIQKVRESFRFRTAMAWGDRGEDPLLQYIAEAYDAHDYIRKN